MTIFIFILVVVFLSAVIAPLAAGLGKRLSGGELPSGDLARIVAELERAEQRLAEAERRLNDAEDRLDFQEKLLSSRSSATE